MPWLYSNTNYPSTPASYEWRGNNLYNQHCAAIGSVPANAAVTQLRVYAAGRNNAVATYLCLWNSGSSIIRYSSQFSMAVGTESGGGQAWQTKSITPIKVSGGTYWVGLYRNPVGGHIFGRPSTPGASAYQKTNTSGFPSVASMSGYSTDSGDEVTVGLFYITAPDDPTSASVSRNSDTSHTISWTRNASDDKPVYNQYIQRWDNVSNTWYTIATLTTDYTSNGSQNYTDTTTVANKRYRYRIYANNTSGNSSYAYTDYIRTTPAAPSSVVATRSGSNVVISWNDNATAETSQTIYRNTSSDGVSWSGYALLDDAIAANSESYSDTSPANYNYYEVRADCTDPTLHSTFTVSNQVIVIQPPDQPSGLIPTDSAAIDGDNANTFQWTHNSNDSTPQSKFSLQYRVQGGAWPGTPQYDEVSNTDEFVEIASSTFTNGNTYEWQVKTWGQATTGGTYSDGSSDWPDTATFVASTTPVTTITDPTAVSNYAYSELEVDWDYTQPDSSNQVEYICYLYDSNDVLLETKTESTDISNGGSDTAVFNTALENNTTYKIILLVKSAAGLWSAENEVDFTTEFLEPTTPAISLSENADVGGVNITITNPDIQVVYPIDSNQDTYINSTYSASNYNGIGQLDLLDDSGVGTDISLILLDFDLSQFAGDTIVSADLYLYRKYALTPGIDSAVNYIKSAWDETTITYASIPTLDATGYDDHTHSAGDSEVWDIATLVQDIVDGTISDYEGMAVVSTTIDGSADYFYDSSVANYEPELIIEISPRNAETSYNKVYRSVAGGEWELVETGIPVNTTITDPIPNVGGNTNYYAEAVSALPSSKLSAEVDIDVNHTGYYYINGGNAYEDFVKLRGDTSLSEQFGRETKTKKYYGRDYPVKHEGENLSQIIIFSCDLPKNDYTTLKNIIETAGNHFWRSYEGDYFKCSITNPQKKNKDNEAYQFFCTIERVDSNG